MVPMNFLIPCGSIIFEQFVFLLLLLFIFRLIVALTCMLVPMLFHFIFYSRAEQPSRLINMVQ